MFDACPSCSSLPACVAGLLPGAFALVAAAAVAAGLVAEIAQSEGAHGPVRVAAALPGAAATSATFSLAFALRSTRCLASVWLSSLQGHQQRCA